jgi:hypothetical protein
MMLTFSGYVGSRDNYRGRDVSSITTNIVFWNELPMLFMNVNKLT